MEWLRARSPGAGPSWESLLSTCALSLPPGASFELDEEEGRLEGPLVEEEDWALLEAAVLAEVEEEEEVPLCCAATPDEEAAGWGKASRGGLC